MYDVELKGSTQISMLNMLKIPQSFRLYNLPLKIIIHFTL